MRRSLAEVLPGLTVERVVVRRGSVVHGSRTRRGLLEGLSIDTVTRHGKQLAIVAGPSSAGPCVCVHLGMSGTLRYRDEPREPGKPNGRGPAAKHVHVTWYLSNGATLAFRDPRRFGGLWTFNALADLQQQRWRQLGPDALVIRTRQLAKNLSRTRRPVKAALLDQSIIAGIGNIYADEALYVSRLHPLTPGCELTPDHLRIVTGALKAVLRKALRAGGSTLRDYRDADGGEGRFQNAFQVYSRKGQDCLNCGDGLDSILVAGRTTVYCPHCQR